MIAVMAIAQFKGIVLRELARRCCYSVSFPVVQNFDLKKLSRVDASSPSTSTRTSSSQTGSAPRDRRGRDSTDGRRQDVLLEVGRVPAPVVLPVRCVPPAQPRRTGRAPRRNAARVLTCMLSGQLQLLLLRPGRAHEYAACKGEGGASGPGG